MDATRGSRAAPAPAGSLAVVVGSTDVRMQLWGGAERLTGLRAFEAEGRQLLELGIDLPVEQVRAALRSVVDAGEVAGPVDVELTDRFGRPQRRRLTATPLLRRHGEVHGAVLTLADNPARSEREDSRD